MVEEWMAGELYWKNLGMAEKADKLLEQKIIDPYDYMWAVPSIKPGTFISREQLIFVVWMDEVCRN